MKRFAKRYGVIIFPSVVFTILSIDVINNVSHRLWLDERWPKFGKIVDFCSATVLIIHSLSGLH